MLTVTKKRQGIVAFRWNSIEGLTNSETTRTKIINSFIVTQSMSNSKGNTNIALKNGGCLLTNKVI